MEKRILIVLAGQLRTWRDVAPTLQRLISPHRSAGHLIDVLMVFPRQSRLYDCGNGLVYDYTGDDLSQSLTDCTIYQREVDETIISEFYKTNTGRDDYYWLQGRDQSYPDYLPVINYWYYRAVVAVEKTKLEQANNAVYDSVLLTRFDHAFKWDNPDILVPTLPPGHILDRRREDLEKYGYAQMEPRYFPDGSSCGSVTIFRNDMIEQMSSSTVDIYNSAFLTTLDPMIDPARFGSLPHHQLPIFLTQPGFFSFEDVERKPNSMISQSLNDSAVRGMSVALNYIVLRSEADTSLERVVQVLTQLGVLGERPPDPSKFIFRKILLGAENALDITRQLPIRVVPSKPLGSADELARTLFPEQLGRSLDFKPLSIVDLDQDDLSQFQDQMGLFDQPFKKIMVSELYD